MADESVFKMSGAASEKLAALQNLSFTERSSTFDQDLSKLVCSFMKPLPEVGSFPRPSAVTNLEGPSEEPVRTLPLSILKPAESWSEVGVRTVADLKTAMCSKKVPSKKSQACDRGVDWRLRSSLYFDFHNERTVPLPYKIPGLPARAESPPLNMEGCTNLTSRQVLEAMRVLEPPKRPTPCRPYTSPKRNSPPRPQGTLPVNTLPPSVPCRRKLQTRPPPEAPIVKQPISAPHRKARMKFTKRRSDLEKDPLTGLLVPKDGLVPPSEIAMETVSGSCPSIEPLCENNNNICVDKYSEMSIQDFKSGYASSLGSPSSGISMERRDSHEGSPSLRSESVDRMRRKRQKVTVSESSCQDSVISSPEENHLQQLQAPHEPVAEESQDVEFFDISIVESRDCAREKHSTEGSASAVPAPPNSVVPTPSQTQKNSNPTAKTVLSVPTTDQGKAAAPKKPSVPVVCAKQDVATQTQQSVPLSEDPAPISATKPKMINLVELYTAVTSMKSEKAQTESSLNPDFFFVEDQLALTRPKQIRT